MPTAKKVLEIARKEIGYQETGNNDTKYGKWYGLNNQPWCYIFVSWVLVQAGMIIQKCASCPEGLNYYKKECRLFDNPKPGDLAFFQFNKNLPYPQHIGFVEKVNTNGTFYSIEGNTSPSSTNGSQDQGDGVYGKLRKVSDCMGFGRPEYDPEIQKHWGDEVLKWGKDNGLLTDISKPDEPLTLARFTTILKNYHYNQEKIK
jgi:hypothetical protein